MHFDPDKLSLAGKLHDAPKMLFQSVMLSTILFPRTRSSEQKARIGKCSLTFYILTYISLRIEPLLKVKFKFSKHTWGGPQNLRGAEASYLWGFSDFSFLYYVCTMESSLMLKVNNGL